MAWERTSRPLWLRCTVGIILAVTAAVIRWQFLKILGLHVPFITFHAAVAIAALYGGIVSGLVATVTSAVLSNYFWMEPVGQLRISNASDQISIIVFLGIGVLVSCLAEAAFRAQARAHKAQEQSKIAAERNIAALELQKSERNYRELVQNANSAIIRWKPDGAITFFNEYARELFGYNLEEIIGRHVSILIPEQESTGADLTGLVENIVKHPEGYAKNINENILKNGSRIWIAWTNKPMPSVNGEVSEILSVGIDITERKRMETQLRENQSRLDLALRSAQMGVWHLDIAQDIRVYDDQVYRMLGIDAANFSGTAEEFFAVVHPDDHDSVKAALARTIEDGVPLETGYRAVWPDGSIHYIATRGSLLCDDGGQPVRLNGLIWDVTGSKRAEEALRESEEHFRSLIKHAPVPMGLVGRDGATMFLNDRFIEVLGYTLEDIPSIGDWWRLAYPDTVYREQVNEGWGTALDEGGLAEPAEFNVTCKDGRTLVLEISGIVIGDWILASFINLTDHNRMERELRKSRDELELRVAERTFELWAANEQLRKVPSRLIESQECERQRLASELHDSIGQILAALKFRIEHVVNAMEKRESRETLSLLKEFIPLLQRSIDETRTIYMGLKPTILAEHGILPTLEWYRQEILKLYPNEHIELETAIEEKDIPDGLKVTIFRVVQEALNNAFKHGRPEWVDVRLVANGGDIELEISDDGIGMDLDYIMESRTAKSLGLIGMKERAELTGGEFTIVSAPNEGTTVKTVWRNPRNISSLRLPSADSLCQTM